MLFIYFDLYITAVNLDKNKTKRKELIMFKFTDEVIKNQIIASRPEGFKMAFDKKADIEPNECLLKIKRDGKPSGRMLVSRIDGTTLLWIGEGMRNQTAYETPAGAMSGLRLMSMLGMI